MHSWEVVFISIKPFEANLAKIYLESEGIETQLQNEIVVQIYGNTADKAKLLVKEKDLEKAMKLLIKGSYIKN